LRINSAKDDAAGLAISTRFDSQIRGTSTAIRNAGDGISLAQTAEGSLNAMTSSLQRIRELALQSANDTNTDVDRDALNAEVQQLIAEIDSVSTNAAFNGKKLLDGSFTSATFQTGANAGETISFSIGQATVDTLGAAQSNGISSTRDTTNTALAAGDLVINGVAVGASTAASDSASTANKDASAISIAAAINKVSERSGVTATADKNVVGGSALTAADASGNVSINGLDITVGTSANLSVDANLELVAQAINEKSGITGVRAELAADADGGINLIADDGRNIDITLNGVTAGNTGLAATGTYSGTVTLNSKDGSPIELTSNTGNIKSAGLTEGTYSGGNSGAVSGVTTNAAGATAMGEGDLVINGVAVGAAKANDDVASTANGDVSAIAIAAAINKVSADSGVTARADETRVYSGDVTAVAIDFNLNGVNITAAQQSDASLQTTAIIDAVNAVAGQTGVTAEAIDGNSYVLIAADGRNIQLADTDAQDALTSNVYGGSVSLSGAGTIELSTNTGNISNSRFAVGTYGGADSGQLLKDVDISTVSGAEAALTAVDNALKTVSSQAADLGAVQSRFESTISTLQATNENLSAANSRIRDADFAAETAALARSQVLQQAGISVLAQANARPQQVLSLLQ
jgi:flagellin